MFLLKCLVPIKGYDIINHNTWGSCVIILRDDLMIGFTVNRELELT